MPVELVVPSVGESITEVEIGDWLKKQGEAVNQDDPVVVIETEKVTVELPAPASGTITSVLKNKGDKASVGDVIGYIETNGAKPRTEPKPAILDSKAPPAPVPLSSTGREEHAVPMTPIRRRIAERLVEAQRSAALLTTFNEIDMSAVIALRQQHQEAFHAKYRIKLGFMSFFVKACIEALKLIPQVNAEIRGHDIVYRNYYDIGIAVGGGKGLVVPVVRNAERMSFAEIERVIADFAGRAAANQLKVDELQGGTFTISNGGIYGSMLSTPIVNPPQSGVLGLHAIADRPVARSGEVVIRPMMYIALTYDHRVVDGREAVTFLKRIKELIEEPARLLLEV
jgi:2-oxoglutarate dehydrogenase E2 component (dihydrolipoamide succinyltransferase)